MNGIKTIIEADDVVIMQGDSQKSYNVRVTKEDGTPISEVGVDISFYNADTTIKRGAVTDDFGVASVPIYLTGDSWFVDVEVMGYQSDESYLEYNKVTKTVTIQRFAQMESFIVSQNLVLNEDVDEHYTLSFIDENGNYLPYEPIEIIVESLDDTPVTYMDTIIKTDSNGMISVPFMANDEMVSITSSYKGSVRYKETTLNDYVTFEDVTTAKVDVDFQIAYENSNPILQWKKGESGSWINVFNSSTPLDLFRLIVNVEDDNYAVFDVGGDDLQELLDNSFISSSIPLKDGDYYFTLAYDGEEHYHSHCRTFEVTQSSDTRFSQRIRCRPISQSINDDLVNFKGILQSMLTGDSLSYVDLVFDYDCEVAVAVSGATPNWETIKTNAEYVIKVVSKNRNIEFDSIYSRRSGNYYVRIDTPFLIAPAHINFNVGYDDLNQGTPVTLTQTGFANQEKTYQTIDIKTEAESSLMERLSDYCIIRLLNVNTDEEFTFYSYFKDHLVASPYAFSDRNNDGLAHLEFLLNKGDWQLYILSSGSGNFRSAFVVENATLTSDSIIIPSTDMLMLNEDNWTHYGTDTPTFNLLAHSISTSTSTDDLHSVMNVEFTDTNYYRLSFNRSKTGNPIFIFGSDPSSENKDGLFISNILELWKDGEMIDSSTVSMGGGNSYTIQKNGDTITLFVGEDIVYETTLLSWNTIGLYQDATGSSITLSDFVLEPYIIEDITPPTETYDGTIFGANWHLELRTNKINFVDYGMLPAGASGGGLVIADEVPLNMEEGVNLEITTYYNNRRHDARLNNLYGEIQARMFENVLSSNNNDYEYTNVVCSPSAVPNAKTIFTRHSDEGTLYYVKPDYLISEEKGKVMQKAMYMCNPYIQYKGGVEITTETGISLFHLDNQYSPIFVGNDLVRAEFHRRSGYIVISRYDEITDDWYTANVLKIAGNLKLELQDYNDDYAKVVFGATTWEFHRGRPFIIVKHPATNIRILNLVDRVYCETSSNEQSMGWIEEHDTHMSTFTPQTSIQKFKQDLHIGENIRTDNFDLYDVDTNDNLIELEKNATISTTQWDNEIALKVDKNYTTGKLALNFPSTSTYLKKPSNIFSLYIGKIDVDTQTSITIKARGFDDNGTIHIKEGIQYGLWEEEHTFTVDSETEDLRATFTCPDEVKYIDFVVIFNTNAQSHIKMTQLMCHEGDSEPKWDIDYSLINANNVEIQFYETYYANLYFEDAPVGLCVIRPTQDSFTLREIKASKETILAPYMKKSKEWDKPNNIFLEYLYSSAQKIDIEWEKF